MIEHNGQAGAARAGRRGLPAWVFMTAAGVLTFVLLVSVGFSLAHVHEGGGREIYALPAGVAVLAALAALLGYRRLPAGVGRWGRPLALLLLASVGLAIAAAATGAVEDSPAGEPVFAPWLLAALVIMGIWGSVEIWRVLDEAAREAHKWAWYWGASVGLALALPLFMLGEQSAGYRARLGLDDTFETGVMSVLLLEVVCYGLAWLFWWARRR